MVNDLPTDNVMYKIIIFMVDDLLMNTEIYLVASLILISANSVFQIC